MSKLFGRPEDQPVPEKDPIVNSSQALGIAFWSLLLMLSLVWALYDEIWGLRPWIGYQTEFVELYREALETLKPERREEEQQVYSSPGYQELTQQIEDAEQAIQTDMADIAQEVASIRERLEAITKPFTTERSRLQAKIYELETASESAKAGLSAELEEIREGPYLVDMPGNSLTEFTYDEMEEEFNALKARQGQLQARQVEILRRPSELRRERNAYVQARLTGLAESQIDGLISSLDNYTVSIKQIHNPDLKIAPGVDLVDRCESCHAGIREPVDLPADQMGGKQLFISHPAQELLQIHDVEIFGCSPCHNGNGVGTYSTDQAHGIYKHWLWPLYDKENVESGCLQCHEADRRLEMAPTLNEGKQIFSLRGCMGCHPREGFNEEPARLRETQKNITNLVSSREELRLKVERTVQAADLAASNEEFERLNAEADRLTLGLADIDTQVDTLRAREGGLMQEVKMVGPNLKEVRAKLRKDWIPVWLEDPQAFRPTTKMPRFRLEPDQIQAISSFIWQSGIEAELPRQTPGDAARGQTLFETRGCMACHSMGEEDQMEGGDFAANLSRVGEKASYDYLVRWILNPRERSLPYDPVLKRDLTPEDYASQGLPFEFDLENNKSPFGDHLLQVQQQTVMPSLRLTRAEARDIASYLINQKHADAEYPAADYMDDPQLAEEGRFWVRHYGCAGCHEIAGLEDEGRIGTDLTKQGSKPIERLDFALLTHDAKAEGWYNHKGFFERKLSDPAVFDEGKIKDRVERLRMPKPNLTPEQINQVTTFLLGSVDSRYDPSIFHLPEDQRRDVQEGWWLIQKYNCVGCHQVAPGQKPVLEDLPRYQGDGREQLPPPLVGEGARANPNWLIGFLKNPALSQTDINQNGVRPYLEARMPTFNFSDGEIQTLIRFFQALSKQPLPYTPDPVRPLSPRELTMARDLFTSRAAPCLQCHAIGDPVKDRDATAPNFVIVKDRLKPDWVTRWMVRPETIQPGTAMPSGLFRWDGSRWVFALADVPSLRGYEGDHAELMSRYMFLYTPAEQRRLSGR